MSRLLSSKTAQILAERFAQCERSNAPVALTVPRAALRSTLGYLILPLWGGGVSMVAQAIPKGLLPQQDGA